MGEEGRYLETLKDDQTMTNIATQNIWVKLLEVSFEDLKWKLSLGDSKIHAAMNDEAFKEKMDKHQVVFGKGDMLKVTLETTQEISKRGEITPQYAILKVEEEFHQKEETELPFDE